MKKKFVFVNLSINAGMYNGRNHGIAFLVPILKKYDYEVEVIQLDKEINNGVFKNKIKELSPSIVGFSCTSCQFKYLIKYSKSLEEIQDILLIAGGVHPTIDPEGTLLQTSLDGVCIGEGEIPLDNLLKNIENKKDIFNTQGFYWNVNGKVKKNPIPQFIIDLSTLEFPDYSVFKRSVIIEESLHVILSRGCPYNCTYCCNSVFQKVYPSSPNYFRLPSVEYSIKLLKKVVQEQTETKIISFEDDNLPANTKWFENFISEYNEKINLPYVILARIECITHDVMNILKNSKCKKVVTGIESGSEYLRTHLLNRKHSNRLIIENAKIIKEAGIKLSVLNIVGFPFETKEQMRETLWLNKVISPNEGACQFFYPFKKTELYEICKENNLLKDEKEISEIHNLRTKPAIKTTREQEKDCIKFYKKINAYLLRQRDGLIIYYFLRPIWELSKFLKTKSKLYERVINSLHKFNKKIYYKIIKRLASTGSA